MPVAVSWFGVNGKRVRLLQGQFAEPPPWLAWGTEGQDLVR